MKTKAFFEHYKQINATYQLNRNEYSAFHTNCDDLKTLQIKYNWTDYFVSRNYKTTICVSIQF